MKTTKRTLRLSRETVRRLDAKSLTRVLGGGTETCEGAKSCDARCTYTADCLPEDNNRIGTLNGSRCQP